MILGLDISHFQGAPNMGAIKAAGRDFIAIKATEGTSYVDPTCNGGKTATGATIPSNRAAAHAAGLIVGLYHFSRNGDPAAEAAWFLRTVGALQPGEFLVLDQEVPSTVAWCKTWLDTVAKATGVNPLIYMNTGSATGLGMGDWSPVASTYGLWLAKYDNAPATQNAVPYWGTCAMKQYSDKGSVLGVSGTCDVDAFYGTADQLRAYGYQGSTDMPLTQAEKDEIVNRTIEGVINRNIAGSPATPVQLWQVLQQVYGKVVAEQYDLTGRPQDRPDDLLGHVLSTEARVRDVSAKIGAPAPVSVDAAAFLAALKADPDAMALLGAAFAKAVNDDAAKRLQS